MSPAMGTRRERWSRYLVLVGVAFSAPCLERPDLLSGLLCLCFLSMNSSLRSGTMSGRLEGCGTYPERFAQQGLELKSKIRLQGWVLGVASRV